MNRRDLFAGLAVAATSAGAQQAETGSLYTPKAHRVEDLALLHDTMDEYPFVELVTSHPTLRITHIPVWIDRKAGTYGTVYGHVAHNNPQASALDGHNSALIVFRGPHSYISPTWYQAQNAVPTWNFAVVHAGGKPEPVTGEAGMHGLLARLIAKFENRYGSGAFDFNALPRGYVNGMISGIVGFKMPIESLEGKFKLGQERSDADRAGILKHLADEPQDRSIREFTVSFYRHQHIAVP